mgnify:CR=1 FL=1
MFVCIKVDKNFAPCCIFSGQTRYVDKCFFKNALQSPKPRYLPTLFSTRDFLVQSTLFWYKVLGKKFAFSSFPWN